MGYAKHVGRVGALAVALGIGSAIAAVPAWADTSDSESSSSAPSTSNDSPSGANSGSPAASSVTSPADTKTETSVAEGATEAVQTVSTPKRPHLPKSKKKATKLSATAESAPTAKSVRKPEREADPTPDAAQVDKAPEPAPAVSVSEPASVAAPKPVSAPVQPSEKKALGVAVLAAVVDPFNSSGGPTVPVESPTAWVALAAARREVETLLTGAKPEDSGAALSTAQAAAAVNAPPTIGAPTYSPADPTTGAVTGKVVATDPEGKKLSYTLVAAPAEGKLLFDNKTGAFTYTPTTAQRLLAGLGGAGFVEFGVTVSDGVKANNQIATLHVTIAPTPISDAGVLATGKNVNGVVATDTRAYLTNYDDKTITVVDTIHRTVLGTIELEGEPISAVIAPDGKKLYVSVDYSDHIAVIDTATNAVSSTIVLKERYPIGVAVSPNGKTLYVTTMTYDKNGNQVASVAKVSTSSGKVTGTVKLPGAIPTFYDIAVSPDGKKIYVIADMPTDDPDLTVSGLYMFSSSSSSAKVVATGDYLTDVEISPDGTRAYLNEVTEGTIFAIDTKTYKVVGTVDTYPEAVGGLTIGGDGSVLLAVDTVNNRVIALDTLTAALLTATPVTATTTGFYPGAVLSPDGMELYYVGDDDQLQIVSLVPHNDFPVAHAPVVNTPGTGGVVTGHLTVTDSNADPLTFSAAPTKGSIVFNTDGSFTYTPTAATRHAAATGAPGMTSETFVVTISDGRRGVLTQDLTVDIAPLNIDPTGKAKAGKPSSSTGVVKGSVTGSDKDKDGLTYTASDPAKGDVTVDGKGRFVYTPTDQARHDAAVPGASKTDSFTVAIDDGHGGTFDVPVTVTIKPANKVPDKAAATIDFVNLNNGRTWGSVTAIDADGDDFTLSGPTSTKKGTITYDSVTDSFTYTPTSAAWAAASAPKASKATKTDSFTVTVSDGHGGTDTVKVKVDIAPISHVDEAPSNGQVAIGKTDSVTGLVVGVVRATDPERDDLTYSLATPPDVALGIATVDAKTGVFTFRPTAQARFEAWTSPAIDQVTFTVTASDGKLSIPVAVTAEIAPSAAFNIDVLADANSSDLGNQGLTVAPDGRFYFTNYQSGIAGNVIVLNHDGSYITTVDVSSVIPAAFSTAYDIAIGPDGRVFVSGETADSADDLAAEHGHGVVVAIDPDHSYSVALFAEITDPASALAVDASGHLYVGNWNNDSITVLNADGTLNRVVASSVLTVDDDSGVAGLALGSDGRLYLTKPSLGVVKVLNSDGSLAGTLDLGGSPWSIAFGANGAAYVTDAANAAVDVVNSKGNVIRTISLPQGANPTDLTIGSDGTVYVAYTGAEGAAIAVISAAPIAAVDPTASGEAIPGMPADTGLTGGLVVAGGVVYQTVIGSDPISGALITTVARIAADGTTALAQASGAATGPVVVGSNGVAYQTISAQDSTTGAPLTGVLVISPTGESTFTGLLEGAPAGSVVLGASGNAYQVITKQNADSSYTTTLLALRPNGAVAYDIAGKAAAEVSGSPSAVVGPNGTVYVTTVDFDAAKSQITTRVTALTSSGLKNYTIAGYATGQVAVAADGTVYQSVGVDPKSGGFTFGAAVAVLKGTKFVMLPDTLPGLPLGSPQRAADGALYQALLVVDTQTGATTTTIGRITGTGITTVLDDLSGTPFGSDGSLLPVVAGVDGTLYQTTSSEPDPDTGEVITFVATMSADGEIRTEEVSGKPVSTIVAGADGVAYQTTYDAGDGITRVAVIVDGETTVHEFYGYPGNPEVGVLTNAGVVVGPDGNAYQTLSAIDPVTGDYTTMVVVISPSGLETPTYEGIPGGSVVVGANGVVYQSVSKFDIGTQETYTTIVAVEASGITPVGDPMIGHAAGPVVVGADGLLYVSVYSEGGAGDDMTAVHVVNPSLGADTLLVARPAPALAAQSVASGLTILGDPIYVDGDPEGIAVSPSGRFIYVANQDGYLSIIDTQSNNFVRKVYTGSNSISVVAQGNYAYVTNYGSNSVSVIDMTNITNPVIQPQAVNIQVGSSPFGIAVTPNGKYVYVANSGSGSVSVIDTQAKAVIGDPINVGGSPMAIAVSPNGTRVYVTGASGGIAVIDTANNKVKDTIAASGGYGLAVAADNKHLYVTDNGVSVIDIDTKVVSRIQSVFSEWVAVSPSGKRVYVTNTGGSTVSAIDTNDNVVIGVPLHVGFVAGVAVSPNSERAYVVLAGGGGSSVQVISTGDSGTATQPATNKTPPKPAATTPQLDEKASGETGYLLQRVLQQDANGISIDIATGKDGKKRVVAYINGTGPSLWSGLRNGIALIGKHDALYDANLAAIRAAALKAVSWTNLFPEVMLVGYSQGGMDVQNISADPFTGLNITTVVTFASPINHFDNHATVHLQAAEDRIPTILQLDGRAVFTAGTGLLKPKGTVLDVVSWAKADVHNPDRKNPGGKLAPAYLTVANDFDKSTDSKFSSVKKNIAKFAGSSVTSVTVIGKPGLHKA